VPTGSQVKARPRTLRFVNGYAIPVSNPRPQTAAAAGTAGGRRADSRGSVGFDEPDAEASPRSVLSGSGSPRLSSRDSAVRRPSTAPAPLRDDPADRFRSTTRATFGDTADVHVDNALSVEQHPNLAFRAYYDMETPMSSLEKSAARPCTIIVHLNDSTITIQAVREQNSGLDQNLILKRQSVVRSMADPTTVTWEDLKVGDKATINGRVYHIVDCDYFTKQFLRKRGVNVPENDRTFEIPKSRHMEERQRADQPLHSRAMAERGSRGALRAQERQKLRNFLDKDGIVLSFTATWDDRDSPFGSVQDYSVRYYLVDNTIEVKVIETVNGELAHRALLNRSKLVLHNTGRPLEADGLVLGETVNVFGRDMFLRDCDDFTLQFNQKEFGRDWKQLRNQFRAQHEKDTKVETQAVEKRGLATIWQEDASDTGSAKKPAKSLTKLLNNEGKVLRFAASLQSNRSIDLERKFVVSFFLADDTISVHEQVQRNSGLPGGKFLERGHAINAATRKYYQEQDLYIGAIVELNKHVFELAAADTFALNYAESHPQKFPQSDLQLIIEKLRRLAASLDGDDSGITADEVQELFERIDADGNGYITVPEFRDALQAFFGRDSVTEQECMTLVRRFDLDGDGRIDAKEFSFLLKP
jgi:EF-hand domain-containing protein 1